jgi:hypothetical protein
MPLLENFPQFIGKPEAYICNFRYDKQSPVSNSRVLMDLASPDLRFKVGEISMEVVWNGTRFYLSDYFAPYYRTLRPGVLIRTGAYSDEMFFEKIEELLDIGGINFIGMMESPIALK